MALSQDDDRCIRQAQFDRPIAPHEVRGGRNVVPIEGLQLIGPIRDLLEQRDLRFQADSRGQQVIELGEYERREQQGRFGIAKGLGCRLMQALAGIDRCQQPARVQEDQ